MASDITREEFETRVGVVEREVEGEKLVSRHILEQTRRNGEDLAAIKTRLDRVEGKLDGVQNRLGGMETGLRDLRIDLPRIVADTMRDVMRKDRRKK